MTADRIEALLRWAAEKHPDGAAYTLAQSKGIDTVTYAQLYRRARQFAAWLDARGVMANQCVGIHLQKSPAMMVVVYGTLLAGACYVPLDPSAPAERNAQIAASCDLKLIVDGDFDWSAVEATEPQSPDVIRSSDPLAPAYILHTSGSTGRPKGVVLTHRNALAFVESVLEAFEFGPEDVFAHHAPLHFDLSVFDLFVAAAVGATVEAVPPVLSMFPPKLAKFIGQRGITVWNSVASLLTMLDAKGDVAAANITGLRLVYFSGDVLAPSTLVSLSQALPGTLFCNIYGQTEANSSLCSRFDAPRIAALDTTQPLDIGRSLPGFDVLLIDDEGAVIEAADTVGQLVVGGATVSPGYWQNAEQTGARFGPDPREQHEGLYYRTGDLARRDAEGRYFFIGRADHQIKTRGYRVELGEVERALRAAPGVAEGAVFAVEDESIGKRIVGMVVLDEGADVKAVLAHLRKKLPSYMLPEPLRAVEAMPRTSTGKVNRQALRKHYEDGEGLG